MAKHIKLPGILLLFISLLGINACSSNKLKHSISAPSKTQKHSSIKVIDLKHLQSLPEIIPKLAAHRTVFVGEVHTSYADHLNQLAVIKGLHSHWKQNTSIGLEMVQQPYQAYLDDYIAGKISEYEMLLGIQWYDRWVYDFRLYRPIFKYARDNHIPLVALNIPRELTRRITQVGIKGLSERQRKQLPAFIDRSNKNYIKRISNVFGRHSKTMSKGLNKFLDAQLGWDEGMAYAAARYLKKHPQKRMLILAGGGHVIGGEGIPGRLDRMIQSKSAIVLNNVSGALKSSLGDYLLDRPAARLPQIGVLGISMKNTRSGVQITRVLKHGVARKAGLKKADVILRLADKNIKNTLDVRLFAEKTRPGDLVTIVIKRNNKIFSKKIKLGGRPKIHMRMQRT